MKSGEEVLEERARRDNSKREHKRDNSMSGRRRKNDERERVQVVPQSVVECLFTCCMCSSLVFFEPCTVGMLPTCHAPHSIALV